MNLDDKLKRLSKKAGQTATIEELEDAWAAAFIDADLATLRKVALTLARIVAYRGIDGREVPAFGQSQEHEQVARFYLAFHCQVFGRLKDDRPPEI
ncbi:MAG: hypothetical protein Q4G66_11920 [bacterium]|nr:hypothetical protein [bacterium]